MMLRMTRSGSAEGAVLLLEGKLTDPWTEELRTEVARDGRIRRLDLSGLSYVDAGGARLLHQLERRGVELFSASAFVRGLLDLPD